MLSPAFALILIVALACYISHRTTAIQCLYETLLLEKDFKLGN